MTKLETAVDHILPSRQMKLSRFSQLNDPFELASVNLSDKTIRARMKELQNFWEESMGVMCFSKHWSSPVMWAHYAEQHKGVCLGFEFTGSHAVEMNYGMKRLDLVSHDALTANGASAELFRRILALKYEHWSYEEEWRLFGRLNDAAPNGMFFYPFNPEFELREIIVGARCDATLESFNPILANYPAPIIIRKARPAFQTFTMVPHQGKVLHVKNVVGVE